MNKYLYWVDDKLPQKSDTDLVRFEHNFSEGFTEGYQQRENNDSERRRRCENALALLGA